VALVSGLAAALALVSGLAAVLAPWSGVLLALAVGFAVLVAAPAVGPTIGMPADWFDGTFAPGGTIGGVSGCGSRQPLTNSGRQMASQKRASSFIGRTLLRGGIPPLDSGGERA
jgi:hypothetical protein